jgi:APA family basic amino acid/polyamine antiporter
LILEYLFGAATVAVGWSAIFRRLLKNVGISLPESLSQALPNVVGTHTLVRNARRYHQPAGGRFRP